MFKHLYIETEKGGRRERERERERERDLNLFKYINS